MNLTVLRAGNPVATLPIDENTKLAHKLMGEHRIVAESILRTPADIRIGDYLQYGTETYYINTAPNVEKINNFTYGYTIVFEGEVYYLFNKLFLDEGAADFSYHGSPSDFLLLIITNMDEVQAGWAIQEVEAAAAQTLSFNGDSCRTALTKIAEAFGMEYRLSGKNITLKTSVSIATTLSFAYGRGNGLYTLQRNSIDRNNLVTKVYGFGSRKNIGVGYRDGAPRLVFAERTLSNNTALYGVREGQVTFEDIFPNRTGTVTAIDPTTPFSIIDSTLNFDINDQLIEGVVAKIIFKTGDLAGYEFEINRYQNASKRIDFLKFTEENGYELPNATFKPGLGDEYTLVDINMPQIYVDAAEDELRTRTQTYLDENSSPRVTYGINLDEKYVRDEAIELEVGHVVNVIDAAMGIDADIRITAISFPLVAPDRLTATISDTLTYTIQERLIAETVTNNTLVKTVDLKRAEQARKNTARFRELQDLVFDPDGYFDGTNIRPNSIETLLLSVGAKSQNFGLNGVSIQANNGGNANSLAISAGQLVHYEIEIDGLGYIWNMSPATFNTLVSATPYYVYARCSKTALTGTWQVSTTPKGVEDDAGQYLFNLGILYAASDGRRDFDFTNGLTFINGDTITTGRIESLDGLNFFDLSAGQFKIGNGSSSLDWNVSTPNKLTLKGSLIQTAAGNDIELTNYRGNYVAMDFYVVNDLVTHLGGTWRCIQNIGGVAPPNGTYWAVFVAKGDNGADGSDGVNGEDGESGPGIVYRGNFVNGMTLYNNAQRQDVVNQGGVYYLFIGTDAQLQASFQLVRYENFGAQFESVATNLLLAENANIADWIIKDGKISSQEEYDLEPRAQLDGNLGKLEVTAPKTIFTSAGGTAVRKSKIVVDGPNGEVVATVASLGTQPNGTARMSANGFMADFAGESYQNGIAEIKAGFMGRVLGSLSASAYSSLSALVGVYGEASNTVFGGAPSYGGYFRGLFATNPTFLTISSGASRTVQEEFFVCCTHTGGSITVDLPTGNNRRPGRMVLVLRAAGGGVVVDGNGVDIRKGGGLLTTDSIGSVGRGSLCIYSDSGYWELMYVGL